MVKLYIERTINIPITQAWPILSDFSNVQKVHPLVANVDKLSDNDRGLDAQRTCHLYNGGSATERITKWDDTTNQYTMELLKGTVPIKRFIATFKATEEGEGNTKLVADIELGAKYGILGKIMEHLVLKRKFAKVIGNVFAGVEHFATTGKEVDQGFEASTPALAK